MANVDMTRSGEFNQKKSICVMVADVVEGTNVGEGQIPAATDNFLIAKLPPDAIILGAYVHTIVASNAATSAAAKLGTTEGGSQIMSAANLKTVGKTGTFTGQVHTDTGVDVYLGLTITGAATDVAHYAVVIDYLEYTKNTGEYTRFN